MHNLRVVREGETVGISADAAAGALDGAETARRALLDAIDDFAETANPTIVPALQPAFAAQAERVRREIADLVTIAQRGRA